MEKKEYPVFIKQDGKDYLVFVPDFIIYTEGADFDDAVKMARDAICLKCENMNNHGEPIPEASGQEEALRKAKEDADDIFDYSDGTLTFVEVELK